MIRKLILLVRCETDDVERMLRAVMRSRGSGDLLIARDDAEATEMLFGDNANTTDPQVIVIDHRGMGDEAVSLVRRIRAERRTRLVPIVTVWGTAERAQVSCSYAVGANSCIDRPMSEDDYVARLEQVVTYWLDLNEPPPIPSA